MITKSVTTHWHAFYDLHRSEFQLAGERLLATGDTLAYHSQLSCLMTEWNRISEAVASDAEEREGGSI